MNIAYMILAHHQPLQLKRLVDRLDQPYVHFFIHVDKKSKEKDAVIGLLSKYQNVKIIANNEVNWMGFTTIDAELDLINLAMSTGMDFKYYVLLSGQDYPIKSNDQINTFFREHGEDFMSYNNIAHLSQNFNDKVTLYHFRDIPYINPRNPKKIPALVYLYFGIHNNIRNFVPRRKFFKNYQPYFGSQWFAHTRETIKYIVDFIRENPGYMKAMKNTDGPDEVFFQTIIMNSERKTNVSDYKRYTEWLKTRKQGDIFVPCLSSLRYMDWSENAKSKPAVLDSSYFDTLKESDDLFARKVDYVISAELLDRIDKELLHVNK